MCGDPRSIPTLRALTMAQVSFLPAALVRVFITRVHWPSRSRTKRSLKRDCAGCGLLTVNRNNHVVEPKSDDGLPYVWMNDLKN